jgi:hypothetical protein
VVGPTSIEGLRDTEILDHRAQRYWTTGPGGRAYQYRGVEGHKDTGPQGLGVGPTSIEG